MHADTGIHAARLQKGKYSLWENLQLSLSFLMACPAVMIAGQNASFAVMVFMMGYTILRRPIITINKKMMLWVILFALSAIASVYLMPLDTEPNLNKALASSVLTNYLYWCLLLLFLISQYQYLNYNIISRGFTIGLICSCVIFFQVDEDWAESIPLFRPIKSPNSFAFLCITFGPVATYYVQKRYGVKISWLTAISFSLCGFLSGSRSGSILVLAGCSMAAMAENLKISKLITIAALGYFVLQPILAIPIVKNLIFDLNPRTHQLLYSTDEVLTEDRSYLTRQVMIEKGMYIFSLYPVNGIGLGNFTSFEANLQGEFEGAELVVNKEGINEKSAHNSYITLLAEGGLSLLIPFLGILISVMLFFVFNINSLPPFKKSFFIAFIMMSAHMWVISEVLNVYTWYMIALCICLMYVKQKQLSEF